jgi:hypothetical protein
LDWRAIAYALCCLSSIFFACVLGRGSEHMEQGGVVKIDGILSGKPAEVRGILGRGRRALPQKKSGD